jgi:hypothetical protein
MFLHPLDYIPMRSLTRRRFAISSSTFADFVAFSNSSWTIPSSLPASVSSAYMSTSTSATSGKLAGAVSSSSDDIPFGQNPLRGPVIGLGAATGLLLLACIGMLCMGFARRRRQKASAINPAFRVSEGRGYPYSTPYDETETWNSRKSTEK